MERERSKGLSARRGERRGGTRADALSKWGMLARAEIKERVSSRQESNKVEFKSYKYYNEMEKGSKRRR